MGPPGDRGIGTSNSSAGRSTLSLDGPDRPWVDRLGGPIRAGHREPAPGRGYPVAMTVRFYVGHGARGTSASMANHVRGLVARGVDAGEIDLPVKQAELAVPVFRRHVP